MAFTWTSSDNSSALPRSNIEIGQAQGRESCARSLGRGKIAAPCSSLEGLALPQSDKNLFRFGRVIGPDSHAGGMALDRATQQNLIFRCRYLQNLARRLEHALKHGYPRWHIFVRNSQFSLAIHERERAYDDEGLGRPNSNMPLIDFRISAAAAGVLQKENGIGRRSFDGFSHRSTPERSRRTGPFASARNAHLDN